jgi:uncharacterized protein DUF6085
MSALEAVVADALREAMKAHAFDFTDEEQEFHGAATDTIVEAISSMQPDHFVNFDEDGGWVIQHSMACRLEGRLLDCDFTRIMSKGGTGGRKGLYVAVLDGERIGLKKA